MALSEAAANLSLEDVPVTELDLLSVIIGDLVTESDGQAARISESVYRTLISPGYMLSDPGYVFDRAHRAGRFSSLVDSNKGGRVSYPDVANDPDWIEARELFVRGAPKLLRTGGPISLKAVSVASLLSQIAPERHPIAERIVMMSAESFLRQDLAMRDPITSSAYRPIGNPRHAYWTFTPAMGLSVGAFRAWSPSTTKGQTELIEGLTRSISREAGRIGEIHSWMATAQRDFSSPSGKSKKRDFLGMMFSTPIFDSATVQKVLRVSDKTARNLVSEATGIGLLSELSSRRTYRIWGISPIKSILKDRPTAADMRRTKPVAKTSGFPTAQAPKRTLPKDEDMDKRLDDILSGLDDIMETTNRVLDRYVSRRTSKLNENDS